MTSVSVKLLTRRLQPNIKGQRHCNATGHQKGNMRHMFSFEVFLWYFPVSEMATLTVINKLTTDYQTCLRSKIVEEESHKQCRVSQEIIELPFYNKN